MDKRSQTSAANGKKGGRPKGTKTETTIAREKAREYLSRRVEEAMAPIVDKAIEQASEGDKAARDWLTDHTWGKAKESIDVTSGGEVIPIFRGLSSDNSDK